jgi:hypothetical protein
MKQNYLTCAVSLSAHAEVRRALRAVGYTRAIKDGVIDMDGIGLIVAGPSSPGHRDPRTMVLASAQQLIELASLAGLSITIERKPREPFATHQSRLRD